MKNNKRRRKEAAQATWFVYMLRCADGSLYTGITTDVNRRRTQHNTGSASRYTRCRRPVEVVHQERHPDRSGALKREAAIKRLLRRQKELLIKGSNVDNHGAPVP